MKKKNNKNTKKRKKLQKNFNISKNNLYNQIAKKIMVNQKTRKENERIMGDLLYIVRRSLCI